MKGGRLMEITFQSTGGLAGYWEAFLDRVWECDPAIVMVYAPRVGTIILELDPEELKQECRDQKYTLELGDEAVWSERPLLESVRSLVEQGRKRNPNPGTGCYTLSQCIPCFRVNQGSRKELQLCFDTGISTYLHYYLPLCVILTCESYRPWFYRHFSKICLRINASGYAMMDFLENSRLFDEVIHNTALGFETIRELREPLTQMLVRRINRGDYVLIHLDEACLGNKHAHKYQYHYVQQSLIYGYDLETARFEAVGFDQNNRLNRLQYSFAEVETAFQAASRYYPQTAPWAAYKALQLIRLKERDPNHDCFEVAHFHSQLQDYLTSKGSIEEVHHYIPGETIRYGVEVYQGMKSYIQKLPLGENQIDYRAFHLLYEHKRAVHERLEYLIALNPKMGEDFNRLAAEYREVVGGFNMIRLNVLKRSMREHAVLRDIYRLSNQTGFGQGLLRDLVRYAEQEQRVLHRLDQSLANRKIRTLASGH